MQWHSAMTITERLQRVRGPLLRCANANGLCWCWRPRFGLQRLPSSGSPGHFESNSLTHIYIYIVVLGLWPKDPAAQLSRLSDCRAEVRCGKPRTLHDFIDGNGEATCALARACVCDAKRPRTPAQCCPQCHGKKEARLQESSPPVRLKLDVTPGNTGNCCRLPSHRRRLINCRPLTAHGAPFFTRRTRPVGNSWSKKKQMKHLHHPPKGCVPSCLRGRFCAARAPQVRFPGTTS